MTAEAGEAGGGRYRLDQCIGRGGLGEVFRAQDMQLNRWVAIKRLHPGEAGSQIHEARHLAALQHPNIVTIYDFIEERGDVLVVMELLHGRTLEEIAEKAPLLQQDFVNVMRQVLEGLIAAHALGMLHRDIKPSNIMVVDLPSGAFQVKLLDFGLAKIVPEPSRQTTDACGGMLGSVFTMAPEQFENKPLDARCDLYSLGCVGYFALSTHYPFNGESAPEVICAHLQQRAFSIDQLRPDLPPALSKWLIRMMALHPGDRPDSAVQALAELKDALAGTSRNPSQPRVRLSLKPSPVPSWRPLLRIARFAFAALALSVAAFFLWPRPAAQMSSMPVADPGPDAGPNGPAGQFALGEKDKFLDEVGKVVQVEGLIERMGVNKAGTVRFLNFAGTGKGDVTLVFYVKDAPADFQEDRLSEYIGKAVRAKGPVSVYHGTPQIVISALSQLEKL